ncbi:MAG: BlaI/MecI/CopY family transcriptional regulator [Lachnospiraceae bacterium]|nr:BlaI/MecI/CopY family transcriptional regulator [Lachnospiraceae bacterium]
MEQENVNLTNAEWNVMECLWEKSPLTGRELVEQLKQTVGWSKSTTLTMLGRMTAKGLLFCDESGKARLYAPCVDREAAVHNETENFLKRVYKGSVSLMMSSITAKQELSKEDVEQLYAILEQYRKEQ